MARRTRKAWRGLPKPAFVGKIKKGRRNRSFLLTSLFLHALILLAFAFYLATMRQREPSPESSVDVLFLTEPQKKSSPKKPLRQTTREDSPNSRSPQFEAISSRIPQVVFETNQQVMTASLPEFNLLSNAIPAVMTAADIPQRSEIARAVSTQKPAGGRGVPTGVDRPQGERQGNDLLNSSGVSRVGLPGGNGNADGRGRGNGNGGGFGEALARIGDNIAQTSLTDKADIVFLIDTSGSMHDNIVGVADSLLSMTAAIDREGIDYRIGIVEFHDLGQGSTLKMSGWSANPEQVRDRLYSMGELGDERALDAMLQTLNYMSFRPDADPHIILVTDEGMTTKWAGTNAEIAKNELRSRILKETIQGGVRVQVLGFPEKFQKELAAQTGGLFQSITTDAVRTGGSLDEEYRIIEKRSLEDTFREIGANARAWVNPTASGQKDLDVLLIVDYSRSMQGRMRAVMAGISAFDKFAPFAGLNPVYRVVRFAKASGVNGARLPEDGVAISPMLTGIEAVQQQLQYPTVGDDHLVDGIVRGVRGGTIRANVPTVCIIITDEPPSSVTATVEEMTAAMTNPNMRFYAIAPIPPARIGDDTAFVAFFNAVRASGGRVYQMPDAYHQRQIGR
ncbi:MAG: VWA domain-containing protein [Candidatus Poribacteria bacterium]|nr:VWA domain-containing protein [Candidatus Poribacteria bacterium]